ncbi:MAG TPA: FeoA family protein [Caulobacterales bacterium]|nr:FeoA family protein [Caulobacterales bacterium]
MKNEIGSASLTIAPRLCEAPRGARGRVLGLKVDGDGHGVSAAELERRLLEIGFVEGVDFEILHVGLIGGDPIAVRVNDTRIALRRREARAIEIQLDRE